jgi:hypothetical protein
MLLGPTFVGHLGLFYFMQQITDHLESKNQNYLKALVLLQQKAEDLPILARH